MTSTTSTPAPNTGAHGTVRQHPRKHLVVFQGLPASGKSTKARALIEDAPAGTVVRINNDEIAEMMFGHPWATHNADRAVSKATGAMLGKMRIALLEAALDNPHVTVIIIDNTNLNEFVLEGYRRLAEKHEAVFSLDDTFLSVPVEECVRRDAERDRPVGREVIERMAATLSK